jgi:hypothetical protein
MMSIALKEFSLWFKSHLWVRKSIRIAAKLAWQEAWMKSRNYTIIEILNECEMRAGRRCTPTGFRDIGGGLYALEQIAPEDGAFPKIFYQRQRIELEYIIVQIFEMLLTTTGKYDERL